MTGRTRDDVHWDSEDSPIPTVMNVKHDMSDRRISTDITYSPGHFVMWTEVPRDSCEAVSMCMVDYLEQTGFGGRSSCVIMDCVERNGSRYFEPYRVHASDGNRFIVVHIRSSRDADFWNTAEALFDTIEWVKRSGGT